MLVGVPAGAGGRERESVCVCLRVYVRGTRFPAPREANAVAGFKLRRWAAADRLWHTYDSQALILALGWVIFQAECLQVFLGCSVLARRRGRPRTLRVLFWGVGYVGSDVNREGNNWNGVKDV